MSSPLQPQPRGLGPMRTLCNIEAVLKTTLIWVKKSHSWNLGTILCTLDTTDTNVDFISHIFSSTSFSPWYFSWFHDFLVVMSLESALYLCCLLTTIISYWLASVSLWVWKTHRISSLILNHLWKCVPFWFLKYLVQFFLRTIHSWFSGGALPMWMQKGK